MLLLLRLVTVQMPSFPCSLSHGKTFLVVINGLAIVEDGSPGYDRDRLRHSPSHTWPILYIARLKRCINFVTFQWRFADVHWIDHAFFGGVFPVILSPISKISLSAWGLFSACRCEDLFPKFPSRNCLNRSWALFSGTVSAPWTVFTRRAVCGVLLSLSLCHCNMILRICSVFAFNFSVLCRRYQLWPIE